jgi:ABC-type transporter Mla subunit MlaD
MAVTASGSPVGYVEKLKFNFDTGQTDVKLRIDKNLKLKPDAFVVVSQPGFLDEKQLAIEGVATLGYPGPFIEAGTYIPGRATGGVTDMIAGQVTQVTELLTDRLDVLLASVQLTLGSANDLMVNLNGVVQGNEKYMTGTMKNIQQTSANFMALSKNLESASGAIAELSQDPRYKETLSGLSGNLLAVSENMRTMSTSLNTLVSDPQLNADAKATVSATRASMEELQKTIAGFQGTLGKVNTLLDTSTKTIGTFGDVAEDVGGVVKSAGGMLEGFSGAAGGAGGLATSVHFRADLDTRYLDSDGDLEYDSDDLRTRDMNLTLGYNKLFAQFGIDNIGNEDEGANILVGRGDPNEGFSYKTGMYRGEGATGLSYRFQKNAGVDAYMYDLNDPKYNVQGKVPVGKSFSGIVGVEDVTGEATATVGVGTSF